MSTTFEVYPKTSFIPSFQDILDLSTIKLHKFLEDFEINYKPQISVRLNSQESHEAQPLDLQASAKWDDSCYGWFHVPPIPGGTDAYFRQLDDLKQECWDDLIEENSIFLLDWSLDKKDLVKECLKNGYYWVFRRSAGQTAIVNVGYGLIAASLAEITEGFIYSDDQAWDYARFPATASDFFYWYFRPELALDRNRKDWATRCIKDIPKDLEKYLD